MGMEISPDISVITNISPNHLDKHRSYEEYIEAKKNIFNYQDSTGKVVLNYDNDITREFKNEAEGKACHKGIEKNRNVFNHNTLLLLNS